MNPIIVIGLVALITYGLYAIYDGLEKQAELAALHAGMLSRQHAEHSALVRGSIEEDGRHIIITNNGPQPVQLIQLRSYDSSGLQNTWPMSYDLPSLRQFNLSAATSPAPPAALVGDTLQATVEDEDTRMTYRGVTSAGGVFEVTFVESGSDAGEPPAGSFGGLATVPLAGSGGATSHNGGVTTYEFYYHERERCKLDPNHLPLDGALGIVYQRPVATATTPAHFYPAPGGPIWWDGGSIGGDQANICWSCDLCQDIGVAVPLDTNPVVPSDIRHYESRSGYNLYARALTSTGTNIGLGLGLTGTFTAPEDGTLLLRAEIPVSATTTAVYDGSPVQLYHGIIQCVQLSDDLAGALDDTRDAIESIESRLGEPALRPVLNVEINSGWPEAISLSGISPALHTDIDTDFAHTGNANVGNCTVTMTADVTGTWDHSGVFTGSREITVSEGDVVEISGNVGLTYTPPSISGASVHSTQARLSLGDAIVTVGSLVPP